MSDHAPLPAGSSSERTGSAEARRTRIVLLSVIGFYLVSILILVALDQISVVWKSLVVPALGLTAALLGRFKSFVRDWALFLGAVILFDACRGLIYGLVVRFDLPVYMRYAIESEKVIFGEPLLTVQVQSWLTPSGEVGLIDKLLAVVYGSHFLWFLLYGLGLWVMREREFGRFKASLLLVMYGGLVGYLLWPTVPPWMAAHQYFVISGVQEIGAQLFHGSLPSLSAAFELNPVAAMPSLHCAFPMLLTLITFRHFGWWGLLTLGYTLLVFLSTVHLGHHYGVDVLGGIALAIAGYVAVYHSNRIARLLGALTPPSAGAVNLRLRILLGALFLLLAHGASVLAGTLVGGSTPVPSARFIARELDGKSPMAAYYRGRRAQEAGHYAQAETLLRRALEEVPGEARTSVLGALALSAYANHDYATVISAASRLHGLPPALALFVAESLIKTGQRRAGFRLLDSVAAGNPELPQIKQIKLQLEPYRDNRAASLQDLQP